MTLSERACEEIHIIRHDNGATLADVPVIPTPRTLKLVEDTVVLIQVAKFPTQMVVDRNRFNRSRLHVDIPYLERHVIAGQNVPSIVTKLDIGDGGNDLGEERPVGWIFFLLKHCIYN